MTIRLPPIPPDIESGLMTFLQSVRDSIELHDGLTSDKSSAFVSKSDLSTTWKNPAMLDNWVRYLETHESLAFIKSYDNTVFLKGTIAGGTVGATARVFILPKGYRPSYKMVFLAVTNTGIGQVDIEATGEVRPVTGGTTWFSLSGIAFRASQ